jgi:hypothetical protein
MIQGPPGASPGYKSGIIRLPLSNNFAYTTVEPLRQLRRTKRRNADKDVTIGDNDRFFQCASHNGADC